MSSFSPEFRKSWSCFCREPALPRKELICGPDDRFTGFPVNQDPSESTDANDCDNVGEVTEW